MTNAAKVDKSELDMKIGIRLADLREETGKTQLEVAKDLGMSSDETYKRWESGTRGLKKEMIVALADYYRVSTDYLLGKTTVKSPDTDLQAICNYVGLNQDTVEKLHDISNIKSESVSSDVLITNRFYNSLLTDISETLSTMLRIQMLLNDSDKIENIKNDIEKQVSKEELTRKAMIELSNIRMNRFEMYDTIGAMVEDITSYRLLSAGLIKIIQDCSPELYEKITNKEK